MVGLPLALWIYKCLMMVIFQRKIIYMGYAPPGARTEELHASLLPREIRCMEVCLESEKHVRLHGIIIHQDALDCSARDPDVVIVYLQGNAGNPLARIPVFEKLLSGLSQSQQSPKNSTLSVHIIAVAPRSYWKSSSRTPTERSLIADYHRVLSYAVERYPKSTIVLYGHSLGGAIAVCLASHLSSTDYPTVQGLVLENPFASIPDMVQALYPQRWLPYRYLGHLAFDKWNAVAAMQSAKGGTDSLLSRLSRDMLVLLSEKDEIVPPTMGEEIYRARESTRHQGTNYRSAERGQRRLVMVRGALHEQAWMHRQWVNEMTAYVHQVRARKDW
ncbi:alpha/beta-hydrolase [Wolfiporia cocos MD-104 SS10]|uniref:Alpha/beta-hydrolase n=1 Tax=Wolfiporia cocos (strain MD-104) TaxID=742152 RepID=A0A2H3JCC3_WOLCO|nr:alpha/beta-hydrolase [Wolfiporia cocos MD-104 SS10]